MKTDGKRWYYVGLITFLLFFNYLDRLILSILQIPIKQEFGLSDTQLGILTGLSFAILFSVMGIPIARLADRKNRVNILATCLALWSAFTGLCGVANNYIQLMLCRVGVGIGEAGGLSPAHSILSDYFGKNERAKALGFASVGTMLGSAVGVILGGIIAQKYGWRTAFFVCGIPGIILALLIKFTMKEPQRGQMEAVDATQPAQTVAHETFKTTLGIMLKNRPYRWAVAGHFFACFIVYPVTLWLPPFISRTYSLAPAKTGAIAGGVSLVGGAVGIICGGLLADALGKRFGHKWRAYLPCICFAVLLLLYPVCFNLPGNLSAAIIAMTFASFFWQVAYAPTLALFQTTTPPHQRAMAVALSQFINNVIGLGLAPVLAGAISDYTKSLGFALTVICLCSLPAAYAFYKSGKAIVAAEQAAV